MGAYVWLGIIALALSTLGFFVSRKTKSYIAEIVIIPVVSLVGFLFDETADYKIRFKFMAILLIMYIAFYFSMYGIAKLVTKKKTVTDNTTETLSIDLPLSYKLPINESFVEDMPANVAALIHMSEELRVLTDCFIARFCSLPTDAEKEHALRSYFLGMCYHLASLFDNSTRVHVRILQEDFYCKYIATYDSGYEYKDKMKAMSINNKMIQESFKRKCSLIKTSNLELHEDGSSKKWKNYLMFALPQIVHDNNPVFTVGISVTRKKNELFYFLNYCEIESIIGHYIEKIIKDEKCQIGDFIEKCYFC